MAPTALVLLAVLVAACTFAGTCGARVYALRRQLVDEPGARRSHAVATPRGGGIAIVAAWLGAGCVLVLMLRPPPVLALAVASGLVLVAGIGWADDHRHVPARFRLVVHAVAATWLATAVWQLHGSPALAVLALVSVLVLVNVWNFMDGIDGLAASQAGIAAGLYAALAEAPLLVAAAAMLLGAVLGFLPMNTPRARIFLGDVGSGALGYLLAVLLVLLVIESRETPGHWFLLLLPLLAFLVDSSLTLLRRIVAREAWWTPHVTHAYQRLAARTGRHWPVTVAYGVWSAILCIPAVAMWSKPGALTMVPLTIGCAAGAVIWWHCAGRDDGTRT